MANFSKAFLDEYKAVMGFEADKSKKKAELVAEMKAYEASQAETFNQDIEGEPTQGAPEEVASVEAPPPANEEGEQKEFVVLKTVFGKTIQLEKPVNYDVVQEAKGGQVFHLCYANKAWRRLTEYQIRQIIRRPESELTFPEGSQFAGAKAKTSEAPCEGCGK